MEKDKFKRYRERFIRNSKPADFSLDMKDLNKIGIIKTTYKPWITNGLQFASLTKEEYDIFNNWTKKEQLQFLEDYFNYYLMGLYVHVGGDFPLNFIRHI